MNYSPSKKRIEIKRILILFLIISNSFTSFSQVNYYYYKDKKKPLTIDRKYVTLTFKEEFNINLLDSLNILNFTLASDDNQFAKIEFDSVPNEIDFIKKVNYLKNIPNIVNVGYFFKVSETKSIGTSSNFCVKL